MNIILTDIDHTISDAAWRDDMLEQAHATQQWEEYFEKGNLDKPIFVNLEIVRYFCKMPLWSVIGLTGRAERWRKVTNMWLWRNGVVLSDLLMRKDGDTTPTAEMKCELIRTNIPDLSRIAVVIEDRQDCREAFLAMGLNVLQYYDGRKHEDAIKIGTPEAEQLGQNLRGQGQGVRE